MKYELSELAKFSKGRGYSKSDLVKAGYPIILYGRLYTNYETTISTVTDTFVSADLNSIKSEIGDVIVPGSGETAEDISRASTIDISGIILGGDLNIIKPDKQVLDSIFLAITISNGSQQRELTKRAQGKSVVHLHNSDLERILVYLPSKNEQTKIGNFFTKLDKVITVNERELNKLKNLKKSYLEKMFPKNGSNIPELRFSGYTDAWVKCELGDVAEIVGGGTPSTSILEYWNGEINWYSPVEIGNQIYVSSSQNKITKLGLEKSSAKILPAYKTILFTSRAGIGNTAIMTTNGATNQGFQSLVIKEKTDLYFLYSISSKIKEMALQIASGSTFLEISGKSLSRLEILVPNFEEQTKIGKFFQHLDNLITVNERELKKLKELKKSYLNDMFV
ncbi:type I restriction endonuclease subunit S [Lactococcus chungangensis CAU 28 = DSM 22330]|uniref:Type I restriction endonuclease subunit S n=1 Tax=Pseudolactococcus chungangensis CAU 28 = DSM 22330 TaxID=1122154 RepID=A0ABX4I8L3_9LACT|nr:type I restriction endonuclease subunit S [Lactococcus chungangensis CAU 28 = DSM 22330]